MAASAARGSLGTVLGACLGCDQPQPPPEAVGRTPPAPSLAPERGVLGEEVGWGRGSPLPP